MLSCCAIGDCQSPRDASRQNGINRTGKESAFSFPVLVFCLWVVLLSHAGVVVQPLRRFLLVSLPPLATFIAAVLLVLQPLADRHGGLFKRAETIMLP